MPRARNLKYAFFMDDELAEHEPLERLFFQALWCIADFNGNIEWRPKKVKALTIPYDDADVTKIAINLDKSRFVRFYSDGEKIYLNIRNFMEHQNPHQNERKSGSDIPEFTENLRQLVDLTTVTINHDSSRTAQDENASNPADSCFLIPDSGFLIPEREEAPKPKNNVAALPSVIFKKPSVAEIDQYLAEKLTEKQASNPSMKFNFNGQRIFDYYESSTNRQGQWMVGANKIMRNWKAAVSGWISRQEDRPQPARAIAGATNSRPNGHFQEAGYYDDE